MQIPTLEFDQIAEVDCVLLRKISQDFEQTWFIVYNVPKEKKNLTCIFLYTEKL